MARDLVEFTRTARALQDVPLAHMVEAAALGVIEAQRELDKRNIEIVLAMGDPSNAPPVGDPRLPRRSLLELGLSPTFYQFTEATFTFIIDITVQESEDFFIGMSTTAGIGTALGASPSLAPGASTSTSPRPSLSPGPGASHLPSPQPSPSPGASPSPSPSPSLPPGGGSSPSPHASPLPSPSPSPSLGTSPSPADWGDVDVVEDDTTEEEGDD